MLTENDLDIKVKVLMGKGFSLTQSKQILHLNDKAAIKKLRVNKIENKITSSVDKIDKISRDLKESSVLSEEVPTSSFSIDTTPVSDDSRPRISLLDIKNVTSSNTITYSCSPEFTRHSRQSSNNTPINISTCSTGIDMLLSLQRAKYGISMYDIITRDRHNEVRELMEQGNSYDDAAMILFQRHIRAMGNKKPNNLTADNLRTLGAKTLSSSSVGIARANSDDGHTRKPVVRAGGGGGNLLRPKSLHSMIPKPDSVASPEEVIMMIVPDSRPSSLSRRNPFAHGKGSPTAAAGGGGSGSGSGTHTPMMNRSPYGSGSSSPVRGSMSPMRGSSSPMRTPSFFDS